MIRFFDSFWIFFYSMFHVAQLTNDFPRMIILFISVIGKYLCNMSTHLLQSIYLRYSKQNSFFLYENNLANIFRLKFNLCSIKYLSYFFLQNIQFLLLIQFRKIKRVCSYIHLRSLI